MNQRIGSVLFSRCVGTRYRTAQREFLHVFTGHCSVRALNAPAPGPFVLLYRPWAFRSGLYCMPDVNALCIRHNTRGMLRTRIMNLVCRVLTVAGWNPTGDGKNRIFLICNENKMLLPVWPTSLNFWFFFHRSALSTQQGTTHVYRFQFSPKWVNAKTYKILPILMTFYDEIGDVATCFANICEHFIHA